MFDLDAYLARIDMPVRPTPDAAGLTRLQHQHRLSVPFENLDVRLGRPIAIDSATVFAKIVGERRGGYCFEQNRLFLDALAALGFAARPLLARVWLGVPEDGPAPPLTHTFSLVEVEGQDWIADAGFGGSYTPPMPLVDGAQAEAPDGARFRLEAVNAAGWMLWRDGPAATTDGRGTGEGWRRQYGFTLAPVEEADLAMGNHWASTAPGTRFVTHSIASLVLPHGFASLTDRHYRRRSGESAAEGTITDPRVYRMRLGLLFGIQLTAEEAERLFAEG
ncbi:arylamine N-acetyltransferase [uncultured Sphingomonas sp.]|uniref:arylamine N-acetyltransferase family protein n=1 Tax=uncultured Sphingomonas sp. TaxID=158754 RepID=UPI0035CA1149